MKRTFKLNDISRRHAAQAVMQAPQGFMVTIQPETRSLDQNAKLWPMLEDVSKQVEWHGQMLRKETWKDIFTAALVKAQVVPGLDGGFVVCGQRTSTMPKALFCELIELIYAFGAERAVHWSEPSLEAFGERKAA